LKNITAIKLSYVIIVNAIFSTLYYLKLIDSDGIYLNDIENYRLIYGEFQENIEDIIRDPLYSIVSYVASLCVSFDVFLSFCFAFFFLSLGILLIKINIGLLLILFFYPLFFNFGIYESLSSFTLRQGLGFSILFISSFFLNENNRKANYYYVLICACMHLSFIILLPIVFFLKIIKSYKIIFLIWSTSLLLYVINFYPEVTNIIEFFLPAHRGFSMVDSGYSTGFKYKFFIFSLVPILAILCNSNIRKMMLCVPNNSYVLYTYLLSNSAGFIFSGFPYYDRILMLSWALIPIILLLELDIYVKQKKRT
jgi:hypothetical protein